MKTRVLVAFLALVSAVAPVASVDLKKTARRSPEEVLETVNADRTYLRNQLSKKNQDYLVEHRRADELEVQVQHLQNRLKVETQESVAAVAKLAHIQSDIIGASSGQHSESVAVAPPPPTPTVAVTSPRAAVDHIAAANMDDDDDVEADNSTATDDTDDMDPDASFDPPVTAMSPPPSPHASSAKLTDEDKVAPPPTSVVTAMSPPPSPHAGSAKLTDEDSADFNNLEAQLQSADKNIKDIDTDKTGDDAKTQDNTAAQDDAEAQEDTPAQDETADQDEAEDETSDQDDATATPPTPIVKSAPLNPEADVGAALGAEAETDERFLAQLARNNPTLHLDSGLGA